MAIQNNSNEIYEQMNFFFNHQEDVIASITENDYTNSFKYGNSFDTVYQKSAEAVRVIKSDTEYNEHDYYIVHVTINGNEHYSFSMTGRDDPYTTNARVIADVNIADIFETLKNAALKNKEESVNEFEIIPCNDEIIKGDIFIIPNSIVHIGEYELHTVLSRKHFAQANITINGEKVILNDGDKMVEIWTCGSGSDNWANHGCPFDIPEDAPCHFISELPVKYLENLKEGDKIHMSFYDREIELTLNQNSYRYCNYGEFQQVLNSLLDSYEKNHAA